jgi:hypothetical protein
MGEIKILRERKELEVNQRGAGGLEKGPERFKIHEGC